MPKTKFDYFQTEDDEVTFTLIDENTVARLQKDGTITLPQKTVDATKDMRWNMKQLNSKLLQGIMNGDPIPKIAQSFTEVIGNNEVSTTRAARTMCTNAENSGRLDSYKNLESQGVIQKKVWIATPDIHTRDAHMEADGQEVDIDEPFILINTDGSECEMMFPADPDGDDEQVWNCRCSMRTHIVGFRNSDGSVSKVEHERDKTTHADQMAEEKGRRQAIAQTKAEEEKPKKPEISFTPAQTIEEAEEYARQNFVIDKTWSGNGNVSYHGMSLDNANMINEEFTRLYAETNMPKLNNIGMMNFRQNIWKNGKDAPMAYRSMQNGEIYFNPNILKNAKTVEAYLQKGRESFEFCKNNMDKFSGKTLEMVQQYMQAGRQTVAEVAGNPLQAMLDHEFGHHIDHSVFMLNREFNQIAKDGLNEYALNLSGYAIQTKGEYIAESYCAYRNGIAGVDPALVKIFEEEVSK